VPAMSETGWCIEHGEARAPKYLSVLDGHWNWNPDHLKALRFSRRADAEMVATMVNEVDRIAEHSWEISVPDATVSGADSVSENKDLESRFRGVNYALYE